MGVSPIYREAAYKLGKLIAKRPSTLVYGGANVGLMKVIAESALEAGGKVVGIMPHDLIRKEVAHNGLDQMHHVDSMAERKEMMAEISDGFIALPGGFGTLDEISEILTLNQLRIIEKPLGLLNLNGYFTHLLQWLDHGVAEGFIRAEHRKGIFVHEDAEILLELMQSYKPVATEKWIADIKNESKQ